MTGPAQPAARAELTRAWLDAVRPTAEMPILGAEEWLYEQLDRLVDALHREPPRPEPAAELGAELVVLGFTGAQGLGATVEILGHGLLTLPELRAVEGLAGKVMSVLAALASGYAEALKDTTDWARLGRRVRQQSLHDLLTGLPNRLHFASHLDAVLERDRDAPVMLCKLDLDCFGVVNEGLGLGFGDLLLRSVATRLHALFAAQGAFLARFDDDEFAILINESPSIPNAAALAARINAELAEPVYLAGRGLSVSVCMGIVVRDTAPDADAKELIRAAEATLHRVRRTGRGQWGLFDPFVDAKERARYALATAMPEAWENGQVTLCYQPLVRLDPAAPDAGRAVALSALLRWEHPEHGLVAHEDCLAFAEQTGLVLSIGRWMVAQACEQLRDWRERFGAAVPPVRVDLTTHLTQDPDLVGVVHDALADTGLQPADIELGMPAEVVAAGYGDAVDNLDTLAEIGVRTVLTRYGQSLGNLVLLESLPVRGVEITGPLVRAAARKPESVVRAAVASMVPLIRHTGAAVLVTGLDDPAQAAWWRSIGADAARGTALAPPVGPQDIPPLLLSR
ncbi:MAG: EAL domain-containing protein [Pseudonocardiaceae bacterium]